MRGKHGAIPKLLVLDDENGGGAQTAGLTAALGDSFDLARLSWAEATEARLRRTRADVIVGVVGESNAPVIDFFGGARNRKPALSKPTLAVLPRDADAAVLSSVVANADDFVIAPVTAEELRLRLERLAPVSAACAAELAERLIEEEECGRLVGRHPAFVAAVRTLPVLARSGMPVLITGETGTGKEVCAQALHALGPRRDGPFVAVDCGALPGHLFENELFGHVRGAYTDAQRDQKGLVAVAEGGTLFLDEIDALSLSAQAKLLRFLQERAYKPLGAERFAQADVNVITATNRDIDELVRKRRFRTDLFYRVNVLRVALPPLRQRRSDVRLLVEHFLSSFGGPWGSRARKFSPQALRMLELYEWPGNVRELFNVVQRALVLAGESGDVLPAHVDLPLQEAVTVTQARTFHQARSAVLERFEREYVEELLRKHGGNVTRAALEAGKERRAFGRLVKKHGLGGRE